MDKKVTITLDKQDWLAIAVFLSRKIGETTDPTPTMRLLQDLSVVERGFVREVQELQNRGFSG